MPSSCSSKNRVVPSQADGLIFLLAPMITFTLAFVAWAVIPIDAGLALADINVGNSLPFCHFLTRSLWNHNGGLGI